MVDFQGLPRQPEPTAWTATSADRSCGGFSSALLLAGSFGVSPKQRRVGDQLHPLCTNSQQRKAESWRPPAHNGRLRKHLSVPALSLKGTAGLRALAIAVYPAAALGEQRGTEGGEGANVWRVDEWEEAAASCKEESSRAPLKRSVKKTKGSCGGTRGPSKHVASGNEHHLHCPSSAALLFVQIETVFKEALLSWRPGG